MELKSGYLKTEAGIIPNDWEVKRLGDIIEYTKGYAFKVSDYQNDGVRIIRVSDTTFDSIIDSNPIFTSKSKSSQYSKWSLKENDLILSTVGSKPPMYDSMVGKVLLVPKSHEGSFLNQNAVMLRDRRRRHYVQRLLLSHCRSKRYVKYIESILRGNANQASITLKELFRFPIALPTNEVEKEAIAKVLSDFDELISSLDQLIAKKRNLKLATMQQLLTGHTRLPGFHDEWQAKTLGELGKFLKGSGVTKDQTRSGSLACVRYGELYTHHTNVVRGFHSWISPEVATTAVRLKKGDILFAGSGETKEEIGKCAAFTSDIETYAGGDIVILRPEDSDSIFLGNYLNTGSIARQKANRGQGDAVVHISSTALCDVRCRLPSLAEQSAIAEVLSDMDAENVALEQERDKTHMLKQGNMQELLTGKTRLI